MECGKRLQQKRLRHLAKHLVFGITIFLIASTGVAQEVEKGTVERSPSLELNTIPGLMPEFSQLFQKIEDGVQLPPPRTQSRLLPLLPHSTIFYSAFPNLGDASHQAWAIFQQQLQQSPSLRAWWQHGEMAGNGPKMEDSLQKFYELSQYLGDEVVISGASEPSSKNPGLLIVAAGTKAGSERFPATGIEGRPRVDIASGDAHSRCAGTRDVAR